MRENEVAFLSLPHKLCRNRHFQLMNNIDIREVKLSSVSYQFRSLAVPSQILNPPGGGSLRELLPASPAAPIEWTTGGSGPNRVDIDYSFCFWTLDGYYAEALPGFSSFHPLRLNGTMVLDVR